MSRLIHQTLANHLWLCRDDMVQQQRFLAVLEKREAKHLEAMTDHSQCDTCELFSTVIPDNRRLLREYTEAYNRAKRGQDE